MDVICHVAIADDWEMSRGFGEYEVATRGVPFDALGHVKATAPSNVDTVVAEKFGDLALPLLRVDLSVAALRAAGIAVEWTDGSPMIHGPIPMDADVVLAEVALGRVRDVP